MKNDEKYIYILYDELGRIKFGITNNFARRINQISNASGLKIQKYYTEACSSARRIEQKLLEYFNAYRIDGTEWIVAGFEFFDVVNLTRKIIKEADDP